LEKYRIPTTRKERELLQTPT